MLSVIVRKGKAFQGQSRRGYHARVYPDSKIEIFDLRTRTWREDHDLSEDQLRWLRLEAHLKIGWPQP